MNRGRITFLTLLLVLLFVNETAFAAKIDFFKELEQAVNQALDIYNKDSGSSKAGKRKDLQKLLAVFHTERITEQEILSRLRKQVSDGKVPAYVFDKGKYTYTEGNNFLFVPNTKVNFRSQPNTKSRLIEQFQEAGAVLLYMGEWINPKGERWVLAYDEAGILHSPHATGWIYGKYVQLIPNNRLEAVMSRVKKAVDDTAEPEKITPQAPNTQPVRRQNAKPVSVIDSFIYTVILIGIVLFVGFVAFLRYDGLKAAGRISQERNHLSSVSSQYYNAAKNGNAQAQYELGQAYLTVDVTQAKYWLMQSALQGYVPAIMEL